MNRSRRSGFAAAVLAALMGATQAAGQPVCGPVLTFKKVNLSEIRPPYGRKWTALIAVDASRCAADASGSFDLVFVRLQEIGPDAEFRERFPWSPPLVEIALEFAADEAVDRYRIDNITPCPCR